MGVVDTVRNAAVALSTIVGKFASTHHDGILALCIFVGLIIAFCGRVILRPTVFLLGFSPTFALFASIGLALVQDSKPARTSLVEALAVLLAVVLGVLVGFIMLKVLFRFAIILICAGLGVVLVLDLNLFVTANALSHNGQVLRDLLVIIAAILAGTASIKFPETSIVLGTAFDGAGLAVYALAKFLGHRPNVFAASLLPPDVTDVPVWEAWKIFYACLVIALGLFAAGMQHRLARAETIADKTRLAAAYEPVPDVEEGGSAYHGGSPEPPGTPRSFAKEDDTFGNYGAMEHEYSVVSNLGAPPLAAGENADVKHATPPL